jgi:hypothetical protein
MSKTDLQITSSGSVAMYSPSAPYHSAILECSFVSCPCEMLAIYLSPSCALRARSFCLRSCSMICLLQL